MFNPEKWIKMLSNSKAHLVGIRNFQAKTPKAYGKFHEKAYAKSCSQTSKLTCPRSKAYELKQ